MSYASATGAQRLEVSSAAEILAKVTAPARAGLNGPGVAGHDDAEAACTRASAALAAVGVTAALSSNQQTLTSGVKVPCGTVTGSGTFATATIVDGVITGIVLSES